MEAKKRFRPRRLLVCRIGLDGGQPQRRQGVAGFARNWAGVPRSHHAGGRSCKPWRVQRVLPAVEECLGAIQKKPSILVLEMCAAHPGRLQPAVALGKAALLVRHRFSDGGLRARRHWLERSPIKPWVAPLAAGCIGESGSRLHAVHGLRLKPDSNPRDLLPSVPLLFPFAPFCSPSVPLCSLCSLCFLLFQISPLPVLRTKMDFYRRSLRTQSSHRLSGSVNREEAHPKSLFLCSLLFPFAFFASFCSKSSLSRR